jgi:eukaryotic-like serine/threonine-protein kinase
VDERTPNRFHTGAALRGRLLRDLVESAGAGAVLPPGSRIGPWRVVELLGSGGMSHVYLAERADGQFEQQVALKLVRGNPELINRLRHERRILAGLRHPNVVGLVDGGETEQGDLWFAMALVEGAGLDEYVRERAPDWRERLRLFDAICAAVEYAHGRGLIHRDIKPANILVDPHGHPRLLDFGIALEESEAADSADRALTPGFASPEQLAGQELSTRSDIFQLGLVLRLLLSGPEGGGWIDLPGPVRRDLADLLGIATADDPAQRYASVAALREDLANLLARRPLASQRDVPRVRIARSIERNRLAAIIAALAFVTLVGSLSAAAWRLREERNQAIANAQRANAVARFLEETLTQANPYAASRGGVSVLQAMDHAAERLDAELAESPEVRQQLRSTIGGVYLNLDESQRCLDLFAQESAEADLGQAAPEPRARSLILRSECHLALDQREQAWAWLDRAWEALDGASGRSADALRAFILVDRGQLLSLGDRLSEANALLEQALALAQRSGAIDQEYRANRMLGGNLQNAGDNERALALLQRALELARQTLGPAHRSTLTTAGGLAISQARLQRWDEAESTIREALAAAESIRHRGTAPDIVIAQLRDSYANVLWQQGRFAECSDQADTALSLYRRSAPAASTQGFNPSWRVATCAYQAGDLARAGEYAGIALGYAENGVPVGVINALRMLAAVAAREGRLDASAAYLARADEAFSRTEVANPTVASALHLTRALLAARSGQADAARESLRQADEGIERSGHRPAWLMQERGEVGALVGQPGAAEIRSP